MKKRKRKRRGEKLRVSWLMKRKRRQLQLKGRRYHTPWYPQRKTRSDT